jgi:hypothetical protein
VRRRRTPTRVVPDGGPAWPGEGNGPAREGAGRCRRRRRGPGEPTDDPPGVTTGGPHEGTVGMDDPARDQGGDGQVRDDHARAVARGGHGVVVVPGVGGQGEVERELAAGEHGREAGRGARARAQQGGDQGDRDGHGGGDGGGGDQTAGLPVRRDTEGDRDETEQHGARRCRSVGGHGPPR